MNEEERLKQNQLFQKSLPKFLGDEYNLLFDTLDHEGDPLSYMYQRTALQLNVNPKLFMYMNGSNMTFIRSLVFHKAVNKVYRTDPEKYKKIWTRQDPRYPQERKIKLEFEKNGVKSSEAKAPDHIYG